MSGGYNAANEVLSATFGNGVAATFGYNARLQLATLVYAKSGANLFSLAYNYGTGNNGQIQSITDNVDNGRTVNYTYDAWSRLKTAATVGSTAYPAWGLSWSYDRYGNRKQQTVTAGSNMPSNSVTPSATTNRITDAGYAYDLAGNMTSDGSNTLTYDAENRVTNSANSGSAGAYVFDGNSLRVQKTVSGATTVYIFSGTKVVAEYASGAAPSSPSKEYIYAGSQLLATLTGPPASATANYHIADHLSPRVTTDSAGTVVGQQAHFPFGEDWYASSSTTKFKFTSYERDSESGNDYAIMRTSINRLGRFSSSDPLAGRIFDPQSLNRYAYTAGDPVNLMDPLGLYYPGCWPNCPEPGGPPSDPFGGFGGPGRPSHAPLLDTPEPPGRGGGKKGVDRKKALTICVKDIFGIDLKDFTASQPGSNGSFSGQTAGGIQTTVTNDVNTFTVRNLNEIFYGSPAPPSGRGDVRGLTLSGRKVTTWLWGFIPLATKTFSLSTNYSASNLSSSDLLTTQIHELGHSLAQMLGLAPVGTEDPYASKLEDCVIQKMLRN